MRIFFCFLLFLMPSASLISQNVNPSFTHSNDTITAQDQDGHNLLKYLTGTWDISGNWQVTEGEGKVKYNSRAFLRGTETFQMVLNGHFLQKNVQAKVSYYSRDFDKKKTQNFSSLTLYTFNQNTDRFVFWSYDSTGAYANASGSFDREDDEYVFQTEVFDDQGQKIEMLHKIIYVSQNEYRWEVKKKTAEDYEFEVVASGTSKRK